MLALLPGLLCKSSQLPEHGGVHSDTGRVNILKMDLTGHHHVNIICSNSMLEDTQRTYHPPVFGIA